MSTLSDEETEDIPGAVVRLGYRSLFAVPQDEEPQVVDAAMAQFHSWLRQKRYDVDALELDKQVTIAEGVTASLFRLEDRDGSTTLRAHVVEARKPGETWESELTVHAPGRLVEPASVLLDISGPIKPRTPKLARLLTGALPALDSRALLSDQPVKVSVGDAEELAEAVCDSQRRGLLFVSGMTTELPYDGWHAYVAEILKETTGLAASYFLDPAATRAFHEIMGSTHAVAPGTVRTFLADADPASELDALRHRILSTDRIVRDSGHLLALLLGRRAQEETLQAELPPKMRRVQRRVAEHVDQLLLRPISTPAAQQAQAAPVLGVDSLTPEAAPPVARDVTKTASPTSGGLERLAQRAKSVMRRVLGVEEPSDQDWEQVTELALRGRSASNAQEAVARQLSRLRDELESRESRQRDLLARLQDEQLEHASTAEELDAFQKRNAYLEDLARRSELVGKLYADAAVQVASEPQDFEELLFRVEDFEFVHFTGDSDVTLRLDQHDPLGVWAGKTWKILCALEDYARAFRDGVCATDVEGYLRDIPDGYGGYSVNKHARTESEDVQKNRKFREARSLPVPEDVKEGRCVEMMAHFKIAQSGLISPRLHYYDDTTRTGKVYVGYIGPHLPTKRTN